MFINQDIDPATYAVFLNSESTSFATTEPLQFQVSTDLNSAVRASHVLANASVQNNALVQPPLKPGRKKPLMLTKEENIKLLQLMLSHANTYGIPKMMISWWSNVTNDYNKWLTRGVATNLSRHVIKLIKQRELQIEMLVTGDKDETGPYIQAIDEWIIIHKSVENETSMKKKTVEEQHEEDKQAQSKRDDWTKLLSQRKRSIQDEAILIDSDDGVDSMPPDSIPLDPSLSDHVSTLRSRTPRITKAKRARLTSEALSTAIIELATAVKSAFETRSHDEAKKKFDHRISRLEDQMQLQSETLAKILKAVKKSK